MRASCKALSAALALTLALSCQSAWAGWYSAHGTAPIIDGDVATARRNAIDDALRNASLQAGADINVQQTMQNGTLLSEKINIASRSPIKKVTVIEEQENGKVVTVLIKALINEGDALDCYAGTVKKTIAPFAIRFQDSEASGTAAGLENIDRYLSEMIYKEIAQSPSLNVLPVDNARLKLDEPNPYSAFSLSRTLDSLMRHTQGQYVVVGSINSVAKSETGSNVFTRMMYNPTRTMRFNIKVYDLYNGKTLMDKDYSGEAEWTFEPRETVIVRSDRFLSSEYGQRVHQLARYAIDDIITAIRCQSPVARVIQIDTEAIRINMGSNDNLKQGMRFKVIHRTDYMDRQGGQYYENFDTNGLYEVSRLSNDSAWLTPTSDSRRLNNVMLDDVVILAK